MVSFFFQASVSPKVFCLFRGGVGGSTPSQHSTPSTDGSSVGVDPSLYTVDSRLYGSITSGLAPRSLADASLHRTPIRTNVSSSPGSEMEAIPSVLKKKVAIIGGSVADDVQDDYSLLSGITAGTSATTRGIRNVTNAFSTGLLGALETPTQPDSYVKGSGSIMGFKTPFKTPAEDAEVAVRASTPPAVDPAAIGQLSISSPSAAPKVGKGFEAAPESDPSACTAWLYEADKMPDLCLGTIGKKGLVCVNSAGDLSNSTKPIKLSFRTQRGTF